MKRSKCLLIAPLTACLIYLVARFCHVQTDGFKLTKITSNFPQAEACESHTLPRELEQTLTQRFTYLGRGLQSFAFVSEDQTTVLKIFNNRYQRKIFWLSLIPSCQEKADYFTFKLGKLRDSYKLAFSEMQAETGLLYLHLSPTSHLNRTVFVEDKLGIAHPIHLDSTGFALQKKGTLAYTHLSELMRAEKQEEAKAALNSMVQLIVSRCKKGIADNDPLIRTNLGFLKDRPFYIDIGPFSRESGECNPETHLPKIEKIVTSLSHWIEANHPTLTPHLEEIIHETTSH